MGCVSSSLLNNDDEFSQMGGSASALGHHIVSLTSTTYGLLSLDPPPDQSPNLAPTPPPRFTLGSLIPSPLSEPRPHLLRSSDHPPDVINSWELMAGLDPESSHRFYSRLPIKPDNKENSNPNLPSHCNKVSIDGFEKLCPPNGENKVVIYTTTLRGVRKTFEDCNAVRAAMEGLGVLVCERDISMDIGFREELRELMKGRGGNGGEMVVPVPPRVFVKGRYLGGAEEVMRIVEEGGLSELVQGLPKLKAGYVCEGCGGARFLPCFTCNGSCKMVTGTVVVRCSDCNENGLVLCPICC